MLQGKEPCEGSLATVVCLAGVLFAVAHTVADMGPKSGRGAGRLLSLPCSLLRSPTAGRRACVHIHALGVVCLRRYQLTVRRCHASAAQFPTCSTFQRHCEIRRCHREARRGLRL